MDSTIIDTTIMLLAGFGAFIVMALILVIVGWITFALINFFWRRFCDKRDLNHIMRCVTWAEENGPPHLREYRSAHRPKPDLEVSPSVHDDVRT